MADFDFVIIGQGLAGTTLAWQLQWLGKSVVIIDREAASTASKVASGLISPITGKRNAVSWRFDQLWPIAKQFYQRVELATHQQLFYCQPLLKILRDGEQIDSRSYVGRRSQLNEPLNSKLEAVELTPAARLDLNSYLDASRAVFDQHDAYFTGDIDLSIDIEVEGDRVHVPKLAIRGRKLLFCQGIDAQSNCWFSDVEFEAAKGEILTLELPNVSGQRIVHGDVWLVPTKAGRFAVGSTYDREFEDAQPTPEGCEEILRKLSVFAPSEYEVVDH
jgi:glycine oxidase